MSSHSSHREAKKDFLIHHYLVMLVGVCFGVLLVGWARHEGIPYALLLIDSKVATGTVSGFEQIGVDHLLSYDFLDHEGVQHTRSELVNANLPFSTNPYTTIEITFFPLFPEVSEASVLLPYLEPGFWVLVIGAAFIVLPGIRTITALIQFVRHSKEDRYY